MAHLIQPSLRLRAAALTLALACSAVAPVAFAGTQAEEPLSASVRAALHKSVSDTARPNGAFANERDGQVWLAEMSRRMQRRLPDVKERIDFLTTVHYEAVRAGLDPEMVLGLIQVESAFRKYALSTAGARGYMQVMPFWVNLIGDRDNNLFHLRTNLRYGCTILRHYLDMERGDIFRALGRYNGSLGQPDYPTMVVGAWKNSWTFRTQRAESSPPRTTNRARNGNS